MITLMVIEYLHSNSTNKAPMDFPTILMISHFDGCLFAQTDLGGLGFLHFKDQVESK